VELAGSLVALVDWFEKRAGCESALLSSLKSSRSPPLIGIDPQRFRRGLDRKRLTFSFAAPLPISPAPLPTSCGPAPIRPHIRCVLGIRWGGARCSG